MTDAEPALPAQDELGGEVLVALRAELARAREALDRAERRHRADREREALLRGEVQHRVRNTLALVRSIFERSVSSRDTLDDLANHFSGRLDVLARYQLSRPPEPAGSVDLAAMIDDELMTFHACVDPRVVSAGPELQLGYDTAQLMGFALHELATNSIKFGVLGSTDDRARLTIEWHVQDAHLHFRWEETGVAILVSAPRRKGFGREFIEQALPYQIGADTSFQLRPGGLCCTIAFPLAAR